MKIILLGANGTLGSELQKMGEMLCPPSHEVNIEDNQAVESFIKTHSPDVVINAAAIIDNRILEKIPEKAISTNIIGAANVANACINAGVRYVYISTDYIYKGDKGNYKEDDEIQPFNFYAWTKLGGECSAKGVKNHLIIRTSFGGTDFPYKVAFSDKWSSKDYVDTIAPLIYEAAISPLTGVLNIGTERKTLYDYAKERNADVKPVKLWETSFFTPYDTSLNLQKWTDYKAEKSICNSHTKCRACGSHELTKYLDLGLMPLVNNLEMTSKAAKAAPRYPLQVMLCEECGLSQLSVVIDPVTMFSNYVYRSSVNAPYVEHCRQMAKDLKIYGINKDSFHIDIACFPANNYINTKRGNIDISKVIVNDEVLSHDGEYHKVVQIFQREVVSEFVKLKLKGLNTNTEMTSNHPVLTSFGWKEASELNIGDLICTRPSLSIGDDKPIDIYEHLLKCHPYEVKIDGDYVMSVSNGLKTKLPRYIHKTKEFVRVLGYYVGNGSGSGGCGINIVFNKKYKDKLEDIKKYFNDVFGMSANETDDLNVTTVRFNSRLLSSFFHSICGHGARNKKLPLEVLSANVLPDFLNAFWFTDGHVSYRKNKHGQSKKFIYSTSSKNLIIDLWNLIESYGIKSAVQCVANNKGFSVKDGILYRLTVERGESVNVLEKIFGGELPAYSPSERYLPILTIEKTQKECEVFNFEVAETNTYVCNGITAHNCNDGTLLKEFKEEIGLKVLGVDPASNLAAIAESQGIPMIADFWEPEVALEIVKKHGHANLITATNVFAHVDNIAEFLLTANYALAKDGVLIIECPYIIDYLEKMEYNQTYFEHLSYMSVTPIYKLCKRLGMKMLFVGMHDIHGGTIRIEISKGNSRFGENGSINDFLELEKLPKSAYLEWSEKVKQNISEVGEQILGLKKEGKTIVGMGASAKGNTLLNSLGFTTDIIDAIVDETSEKIGKFSPGTGIPIVHKRYFAKNKPDYVIILAENFKEPLMKKAREAGFSGEFIISIPKFEIL